MIILEWYLSLNANNVMKTLQMLQRLPIALAQVKAGKITEKLTNKIKQIMYFLNRTK